jgi:hypothetical protein
MAETVKRKEKIYTAFPVFWCMEHVGGFEFSIERRKGRKSVQFDLLIFSAK